MEKHGSGPWSRGSGAEALGTGGRVCYLPRELRVRLFDVVVDLRRKGLSYSEIVGLVQKKYGVRLSKSHVSYWLRRIHSPYNGRYIPSIELLRPSKELAYVIGVVLGDGYTTRERRTVKSYNNIRIGLYVKDKEFAEEFSRCLAKVLDRRLIKPRTRTRYGKSKRYVVEVRSQTLYELLKKPVDLDKLRQYIEHSEDCMAAFIRGFADSEGSVSKSGQIRIANTDRVLLKYIKDLLEHRLGVAATGPWPKVSHDPNKKDCYYLLIRASSNLKFYEIVGLTIKRKQRRLKNYIKKRQAKPPSPLSPPYTILNPSIISLGWPRFEPGASAV